MIFSFICGVALGVILKDALRLTLVLSLVLPMAAIGGLILSGGGAIDRLLLAGGLYLAGVVGAVLALLARMGVTMVLARLAKPRVKRPRARPVLED